MKTYSGIFIMLIFLSGNCSAPGVDVSIIKIKGSDSMLKLNELLAEEFMERHPGVSVYVDGGGTAAGIKALSTGATDICSASRTFKADEVKDISDKFGSLGLSFMLAKDAVSIFVNPANPIDNFSQSQLKDIFTGEITNWKELGWDDELIQVVVRNPNSGTQLYFKEHLLGDNKYSENVIVESTTEQIIRFIADRKYAISFGSFGYHEDVKLTSVDGISISKETIQDDTYPITRYLMYYTLNTPRGSVKEFIDWCLSPEGQSVVKSAGYIPLWNIPY